MILNSLLSIIDDEQGGFMIEIDDYELKIRRQKLISHYHQYQSNIDNTKSGNIDKNYQISSTNFTAQIAGRSVAQISSASKEMRVLESHANTTKEDRILQNYVNTVKKIESHLEYQKNRN